MSVAAAAEAIDRDDDDGYHLPPAKRSVLLVGTKTRFR